ncbi:Alcohol dehydrogenase zinc-binding domain protein [Oscillochloris trichoides DG-6]|uniref:Alcohol dehydrogenase zinc-binding domain protein n=1 Tax=Oscillochloris trichoides DG-6 TaxID=765420 RepID=E1IBP1_9CHLR|nr:quinone oxidoreductase [Oscillochloris trichoides]EFO81460.1 Alcohol dehydrogenase zinc-binding domain protein [Oscillochloris trichoides DG-6]
MRAIRFHETGGPEVLRYDEVDRPEPGPGQVRVKVTATGLNYIETYHRSGLYQMPLPCTPGSEFAGTVDALGAGVNGVALGDRVATASGIGGYAEYALVPADKLVHVPAAVELDLAAAVMLQGMTAHYLVYSTYPLKAGETCLIHAAAGGVGLLLVQMARRIGARVIATVGSEAKAELARAAGADAVILYREEPFAPRVRELTAGRGVDVVYDSVGKDTWEGSLDSLRPRGMLVSFGNASGPVPPISPLVLSAKGSLFLTRPTLWHYLATPEELAWRAGDLFTWMANGDLHVRVDRRFSLADAADAHRALEGRETAGKVLIVP